ncbi:MAG: histidine kinase [Gemmatimonadetes bacterium]|nr:histidine kinase [Gemmatimonadota bacterium]
MSTRLTALATKVSKVQTRYRAPLIVFGLWVVVWLVDSLKEFLTLSFQGVSRPVLEILWHPVPWWVAWVLLTPLALLIATRARPDSRGWPASLSLNLVGSIAIALLHIALATMLSGIRNGDVELPLYRAAFENLFNLFFFTDILTYWAIAAGYYSFDFYRRYRERQAAATRAELQTAELQTLVAEARLNALRMELNPHFLFNTLNAIAGLVRRRDNDDAVRMIAQLGNLFRSTLDRTDTQEVTLSEELDLLEQYLEIERIRFRNRLSVEITVPSKYHQAFVPTLILQPLVENAVRHGVAQRIGPSTIAIDASSLNGTLKLRVSDFGNTESETELAGAEKSGIGLTNTKQRLEQLYGSDADIELENIPAGGVGAILTLPLHYTPVDLHGQARS